MSEAQYCSGCAALVSQFIVEFANNEHNFATGLPASKSQKFVLAAYFFLKLKIKLFSINALGISESAVCVGSGSKSHGRFGGGGRVVPGLQIIGL